MRLVVVILPQFDPLHDYELDVDGPEETARPDERPVFVAFDVDLHDRLLEVRHFQEVVHDDRRRVRRAVGLRAEAVGVLRGEADSALVVGGNGQLEGVPPVGNGVRYQDYLAPV